VEGLYDSKNYDNCNPVFVQAFIAFSSDLVIYCNFFWLF